ncbi:MerR family transcriptional regulator [Plantibacter flavus]|uniref:MerR family transcriptional regulator n=1 Tax=Plantibacter flavus TaxID=150123 RepID=UPI002378919E|nr:MerR family transcriptional regulator [Plantibacter flavus]MDD9154011.1 MerR family transcriptional regulator [Plantibacter flavus]
MRIGELARRTGLATSAIRFYEQRDMFSPGQVERRANGYRDYGPSAVRRLELIQAGRAAGFSLDEMRNRMRDWDSMPVSQRVDLLREQLEVIEERMQELARGRETVRAAIAGLSESDRSTG